MGIWKQRIDESWLKASLGFRIININGLTDRVATAISLKHQKIDRAADGIPEQRFLPTIAVPYTLAQLEGFMANNIGTNTLLGDGIYSYILDYYFGPAITSTKKFSFKKNYQFKTHVYNFAYAANRGTVESYLNNIAYKPVNGRLYYSYLNIFKGALGINPTWEDSYYFDVPYYKTFDKSDPKQPTTYVLYYYSSPKVDTDSEFVSFTNKISSSKIFNSATDNYEVGSAVSKDSVYQTGYGIAGLEVNEIGWKLQGYSFASYDNDPNVGDYNQGLTNSYSGNIVQDSVGNKTLPKKEPLKRCLFGKGWYYDDTNNEYTWYDQQFGDELDDVNNPVGGDAGIQESHYGYRENNYIAKYIPFQKFNLSFLYECLRSDSGIKLYLSPTLPSSKALSTVFYRGLLLFPSEYFNSQQYGSNAAKELSLVSSSYQLAGNYSGAPGAGLPLGYSAAQINSLPPPPPYADGTPRGVGDPTGTTYSFVSTTNPTGAPINVYAPTSTGIKSLSAYAQSNNSRPWANLTITTPGGIPAGSVITLNFNSSYANNGTNIRFDRSFTIKNPATSFQAAYDSEIKPLFPQSGSNQLFFSQTHPWKAFEVFVTSTSVLSVRGTEAGRRTWWTGSRYGRVWVTYTIKSPSDAARSSIIKDYTGNDPKRALVNNIFVDDENTNLKEIKVNITLRHTYIADMIISLRVPNGNVINLKAKYSGSFFNDLRNITFTTKTDVPKMQGLNFWPTGTNRSEWGYVWDPIGIPGGGAAYPIRAPWLPGGGAYNFDWSQLRIRSGLTFQMDKNNGLGTSATLNGFNNIYKDGVDEEIDFRSNVNDIKYLVNDDGTFNGTYSLYIKDDWGGDSGLFEDWNIEFLYKKVYTPIFSLTQSDVLNTTNKGAAKLQYLFGLEGNQFLFIVGDKVAGADPNNTSSSAKFLRASLKSLKIDGGYHDANNRLYRVNDAVFGEPEPVSSSTTPAPPSQGAAGTIGTGENTQTGTITTELTAGEGGDNSLSLLGLNIPNVSYSTYVGNGNLNDPNTLSISSVTAKIGNGKFLSGIWENGAWNSGWRKDDNIHEFYDISEFFSYNRDKRWRFSIVGSMDAVSKFEVGDKVSIGNIVAIDVNDERKLIKSYFTIMTKTLTSIAVEFESDFPIRRIKIDSSIHRIYITKNVWLTGGFFNGYFTGVWNNGLFKGFPYITEMFDTHWLDGKFDGGHFQSTKRTLSFSNTYLATLDRIKVGMIFDEIHKLTVGDTLTISSTFSTFGTTKVISVPDDYRIIIDMDWNISKDPNTYGGIITGTISTNISTGLVQNIDFNANNASTVTSLQSLDNTRVFMYDSWMDVNFDNTSAVNIGKPQSTIDNSVSTYAYSDNNLYGYPTYDVLSSNVTFRDSFSNTVRKYRLGSKYRIYEDYIGDAGDFGDHFDITGWTTKTGLYRTNTFPFIQTRPVGQQLPTSAEFVNQGWVFAKDGNPGSAISFERTTEALDDEDPAAGKEMMVKSVGKGGVLNIQPSYEVANRTNAPIAKQRYTIIKFDLIQSLVPDFIFEDGTSTYDDSAKYQPLIHFNNLNYALRRVYVPGTGYRDKKMDTTYFPVYKNVNHVSTPNKSKIEYFYNKTNLSMFFRGNGLNGTNVSTFVIDNLKLYEVDMIPFFQYFNTKNINKSVSVPYQAYAPNIEYVENEFSLLDNSIYGLDSFYIYQPGGEVSIQAESAAAAAEAASQDPQVAASTGIPTSWGAAPHNSGASNNTWPTWP
jgi:subtilisin-like proprotein convertase family protein